MKKRKNIIILALVSLGILMLLIFSNIKKDGYTKVETLEDVPSQIVEKLHQVDLEQGAYIFTSNFSGVPEDALYIAICGGNNKVQGYDVSFKEFESDFHWSGRDYYRLLKSTHYNIIIEEYETTELNYVYDFSAPLVIFKITQPEHAYRNSINIMLNGEKLLVNKWWGLDALKGEYDEFTYEIIQNKEDIPNEIWARIQSMEFEETRDGRMYIFTKPYTTRIPRGEVWGKIYPDGSFYDGFEQYILLHGSESDKASFNVTFEDIMMRPKDFYGSYVLNLRKLNNKFRYDYSNGFDHAFVIIKIADKVGGLDPEFMAPEMNLINDKYKLDGFTYKRIYVIY